MTQTISTTLKDILYKEIKKKGWAFNELLELGYETRIKMAKTNNELNLNADSTAELEARVKKWIEKSYELQARINELEEEVKKLQTSRRKS